LINQLIAQEGAARVLGFKEAERMMLSMVKLLDDKEPFVRYLVRAAALNRFPLCVVPGPCRCFEPLSPLCGTWSVPLLSTAFV
jgi:hypothetical protein